MAVMEEHTVIWDDAGEQAYLVTPTTIMTPDMLQPIPTVITWVATVTETETVIDYDSRCRKVWGIDYGLDLTEAAADFYLLYDLWLDGLDDGQFEVWLSVLVTQLSDYTDMIVGGELRHLQHRRRSTAILPEKLASLLNTNPQFQSRQRSQAWYAWYEFRQEYGLQALEWAVVGFGCFVQSNWGGSKWATIATTLLAFLRGDLTPIAFVDVCWGLQHNGGTFFSKVWAPSGLMRVLEANLNEDMVKLQAHASDSVRKLYVTQRRSDVPTNI